MTRRHSPSERLFRAATMLYPAAFREAFGEEMQHVFRDQLREARARAGTRGVLRLWLSVIPSIAVAAPLEYLDALRDRMASPPSPETTSRTRSDGMFEALRNDLQFALRMLRKSPVFTFVAVLVIALGSGAVTTIFSAMNAIVLRPLPGTTDASRLIGIERKNADASEGVQASYHYYAALRDRSRLLDGVAAWSRVALTVAARGEGVAVLGNMVSGNYFSLLGIHPAIGRFFVPDEDRTPLANPVIVVSEGYWRTHLGGDRDAVGTTLMVNGHPYTLVGVAPAGFRGAFAPVITDAWVPLMMQQQLRPNRDLADAVWLWTFGRMKDGVTRAQAKQELDAITAQSVAEGDRFRSYTSILLTGMNGLPSDAHAAALGFISLLLGASVLVLLIASVNVASMLSARAIARRREMAVRAALGARRSRLVRQLLTEILVLFGLGGIGGIGVALLATNAFEQIQLPGGLPLVLELSPDFRVFAFALGISLATGVAFGLSPAMRAARNDITARLRSDAAASGTRRTWFGNALIVGQLALSLVLLVSAGLFLRALDRGARIDPGLDLDGVSTVAFNTEAFGYDDARGRAFYGELRQRLQATPGVSSVSYSNSLPLTFASSNDAVEVGGFDAPAAPDADAPARRRPGTRVSVAYVDADYFSVIRIPVVSGRALAAGDDFRAAKVAVVNATFARKFWPGGDATGRTFRQRDTLVTIVGVARDSKYTTLNETTPPFVYYPLAQQWQSTQSLMVRASIDPVAAAAAIQQAVHAIDPLIPRPTVVTLRDASGVVLFPQRVAAIVTATLGAVGLLLASVGLYGVMAYSTGRRTREIGLRMALGAERTAVLRMIVGDGMRLAGIGVAAGLFLAAVATRLLTAFLFGVSPLDWPTFMATAVVLAGVALIACYLPARRAAATDPMAALRAE